MTGEAIWLLGHCAVLGGLVATVVEPGPAAVAVLARRYGAAPFLAAPVWAAWIVAGARDLHGTLLATGTIAVAAAGLAWLAGSGPRSWWRALRRIVLRVRWTSAARACELCVVERRPAGLAGADTSTITSRVELEHTPAIWHGRALTDGAGVAYRVSPARGSSIDAIAAQAEQLAAALHVARVIVHRRAPDRGDLEIVWRL